MDLKKIIGKKVLFIKGSIVEKRKRVEPEYILFDDKETYIRLEEQDYYDYHDCSGSARHIEVVRDKLRWEDIMKHYPDANIDIGEGGI